MKLEKMILKSFRKAKEKEAESAIKKIMGKHPTNISRHFQV